MTPRTIIEKRCGCGGEGEVAIIGGLGFLVMLLLGLIMLGMWGCPQYYVWQQKLEGEAELAKANYSKQVAVQEALAKRDAATNLADAEIARAKGVAAANQIIGESLKDNEAYLRWLWIEGLRESGQHAQIIYIPTEGGIPILEAGRAVSAHSAK